MEVKDKDYTDGIFLSNQEIEDLISVEVPTELVLGSSDKLQSGTSKSEDKPVKHTTYDKYKKRRELQPEGYYSTDRKNLKSTKESEDRPPEVTVDPPLREAGYDTVEHNYVEYVNRFNPVNDSEDKPVKSQKEKNVDTITKLIDLTRSTDVSDSDRVKASSLLLKLTRSDTAEIESAENNGGKTDCYQLDSAPFPINDFDDFAQWRGLNGFQFNIGKVAWTFNAGRHKGTDALRDINKVIHYAEREKARILREQE